MLNLKDPNRIRFKKNESKDGPSIPEPEKLSSPGSSDGRKRLAEQMAKAVTALSYKGGSGVANVSRFLYDLQKVMRDQKYHGWLINRVDAIIKLALEDQEWIPPFMDMLEKCPPLHDVMDRHGVITVTEVDDDSPD